MSGASTNPVPAARCVLWHPHAAPPPKDLIDAIQRRGLAWTATDRMLAAVVQTLAHSPTATPAIPTVLVLIDPPHLPKIDDVIDVITRYRARTALWVFDLADPSRLKSMQALEIIAKYVPHKNEASAPMPPRPSATSIESGIKSPGAPWRLQLAESSEAPRPAEAREPAAQQPLPIDARVSTSSISKDKLSMLIQPSPRDAGGIRSVL